jgi:hypothetical protein
MEVRKVCTLWLTHARTHTDMQIPHTWAFVCEPAAMHAFRNGSSTCIQQEIFSLQVGKFDEKNALNVVVVCVLVTICPLCIYMWPICSCHL